MCLKLKHSGITPRIAERDIVVYKLGYIIETTKEFLSLYQSYMYCPKRIK